MAEDYGVTQETTTQPNIFAGNHPPVEKPITVKSGSGVLSIGTLLGRYMTGANEGKYTSIRPGTAYADEDIGDGDDSTKAFLGTLAHPGVKPGSAVIHAVVVGDGIETFRDNGDGTLTSDGATPGTGTIVYATGEYSVTFFVAPKSGVNVYADYVGLLTAYVDEDVGTGTAGGQTEWSGYFAHPAIVPGSLRFYTNDTTPLVARDNGHGEIVGDATGSVNYETGEYDVTFETAPAESKTIHAEYCSTDGTDVLRAILAREVDATSSDVKCTAYVHGEFNRSGITWPTGTSEAQKDEIALAAEERGIYIKNKTT